MTTSSTDDPPATRDPNSSPQIRRPAAEEWPEVLKAQEVADYLRVSYLTVLRMTHAGQLNAIRVGREFRYLRDELDAQLRSPAGPPTEDLEE